MKRLNMKNLLITIMLFFILASCEKNEIETMKLDGAWLETSHKTDTLVYNTTASIFYLNRGTEVINGFLLPKHFSGPYFYEITGDSISVNWWASSVGIGVNYYFNLDSEKRQIRIGNFFIDSLSNQDILTFSKIP